MADLDDLFGALDNEDASEEEGEEEGHEEQQPSKKVRLNNHSFANVMGQSLQKSALKLKNIRTDNNTETSAPTGTTTLGPIASGTAHDKSVRVYTAHPETPLPPRPKPSEPAKTFPFQLDPFQQRAVDWIDAHESVLVAAHTSAGKTAVAEYAVATALKAGQRVVYTAPIKALSNQKFRDLSEEFDSVGLLTGDVSINPEATCLVMTTEILRSMLYRGSELMREIAWVIYDEVHYLRDSERGVVWEESMILLPHECRMVFLSATIPNASEFADWIAWLHHQPCHVVYTNYRPTPLQHYVFPAGGKGLFLVVDEKGNFRRSNFEKAMGLLQNTSGDHIADSGNAKGLARKGARGGQSKKQQRNGLFQIVQLIMQRNLNPCIIFSFSKKDCERYALALKEEDYTDDVEKDLISQVYRNAIDSLSKDDQQLPQVEALLPLLKRGIGIHHGGLLPILKEIVEILFTEGLVKCLFATETFAIGINAPAKTVVFTNTRKWDGQDFRWVQSGEYIQMSGRAGRRGKDDRGIVIQMVDEKMEPAVCQDMLYGQANRLDSSFTISYNMLLNLMRVEDVNPEFLIQSSFYQFQRQLKAPGLLEEAEQLEVQAKDMDEPASSVVDYFQMHAQLEKTRVKIAETMRQPDYCLRFLQFPGRFLDISIDNDAYGWGVLWSAPKQQRDGYILEVLLSSVDRRFDKSDKNSDEDAQDLGLHWRGESRTCRPANENDTLATLRVFSVKLEDIDRISAVVIKMPQDVTPFPARRKLAATLTEVHKRCQPDGVPLLDPVKDMKITEEAFATLMQRAGTLTDRLASHSIHDDYTPAQRDEMLRSYTYRSDLLTKAKSLRDEARSCQAMVLKDDLKKMKRVLRKLGHVDANGVIQTKGRTACEINTAAELVVVELMYAGVFNDLTVEQCMSLLSCMTFDERNKDDDNPNLKSVLANPFYKLQEVSRSVAKVVISCGIEVDEDEFVDKFNPGMMEAVYAWCKGAKFVQVQKLTGSFEGTTIRTLRRLEELVRQVTSAAKAVGNTDLEQKFAKGSELLKRDIVFCSSLYL